MKLSLPIKLGIFVVLLFSVVIAVCLLWTPVKVRYYVGKYESCADAKERIRIVDILCNMGEPGKKALYKVFREFCISEQVKIPAGSFMMGSDKGNEYDERPVHKASLTAFYMDKYEVTNEKYYVFIKSTGYETPRRWDTGSIPEGLEFHPVIGVSWDDAKTYADWLCMNLPTESQWEYACRAGSKAAFCFGDNETELGEYAWYREAEKNKGIRMGLPVGQKKPNKWGLYDMHGNVWEWCSDWHGEYARSTTSNPKGPEIGTRRILRGGGWGYLASYCRSASRIWYPPGMGYKYNGFRVVHSSGM
jgi:formylglycine-generating enzyme required for sulfatase activity